MSNIRSSDSQKLIFSHQEDMQQGQLLQQNKELLNLLKSKQIQIDAHLQPNDIVKVLQAKHAEAEQKIIELLYEVQQQRQTILGLQTDHHTHLLEEKSLKSRIEFLLDKLSFMSDQQKPPPTKSNFISSFNHTSTDGFSNVNIIDPLSRQPRMQQKIPLSQIKKKIFDDTTTTHQTARKNSFYSSFQADEKPYQELLQRPIASIHDARVEEFSSSDKKEFGESLMPQDTEEDHQATIQVHKTHNLLNQFKSSLKVEPPTTYSLHNDYTFLQVEVVQSTPPRHQTQFFEEFMVVSASKENIWKQHLFKRDQSIFLYHTLVTISVPPETLFIHPNSSVEVEPQLKLLPQLIYPYGIRVRMEEKTKSMSSLKQILLGGSDQFYGVHVVALKTEKYYQSADTNVIYCVCVEVQDFYDVQRSANTTSDTRRRKLFYAVQKTYCFLTRVIKPNTFIDCLKAIINTIKIKKVELYARMDQQENLDMVDNLFFMSMERDLRMFLESVLTTRMQESLSFMNTVLPKTRPPTNSPHMEWGLSQTINSLTLDQYIHLLLLLMMEQNVCILSDNKPTLYAMILVLPNLIEPFPFPHPIIATISPTMLPFLDSPVPFLCGILKDHHFGLQLLGIARQDDLISTYSNIVFFDADRAPHRQLHNLDVRLQHSILYKELTKSLGSLFDTIHHKIQKRVSANHICEHTDEEYQSCLEVLQATKECFQNLIIRNLPLKPPLTDKQVYFCPLLLTVIEPPTTHKQPATS